MIDFEPKYITFDCYGTLTPFRMAGIARELYADRLQGAALEEFVRVFAAYRRDEVIGAWKPYRDVIVNSVKRTCQKLGVPFSEAEAEKFYLAVPTWGPHPDVPAGLSRLAKKYKLVILSNASDDQMGIGREIGMDGFYGGLLQKRGGQMHMGKIRRGARRIRGQARRTDLWADGEPVRTPYDDCVLVMPSLRQ